MTHCENSHAQGSSELLEGLWSKLKLWPNSWANVPAIWAAIEEWSSTILPNKKVQISHDNIVSANFWQYRCP